MKITTAQIIADLQRELAETKRRASNEIYVLKEQNRYLKNEADRLWASSK